MAYVPSLEGTLYLTDIQSIIAYTLRKFFRTPKNSVPLLDSFIISLPALVSEYGRDPETLTSNIQSSLQGCFDRIFNGERDVRVSTSFTTTSDGTCDVSIAIVYAKVSGEIDQLGTTISLGSDGRLIIPEDKIPFGMIR